MYVPFFTKYKPMNENKFLTVSQLNAGIKSLLNTGFAYPVWVCGEIQQYDRNKSKTHVFFELLEKDAKSQNILARIGLVIFANRKSYIHSILAKNENGFALKDDIEVKFLCRVDFYSPHGAIRLVVEDIDPTYTLGKIAQERQRLILDLKKKGVLDKNKELSVSSLPLRIGVITSYDSAAYNDFISEIKKSDFGFQVFVRNTLVQGQKVEKDVCNAIKELHNIEDLDIIVITRGGGSIAELSCFDSQKIAENIAKSKIPIFSGIGHEINMTITDLAAHTYAKTPTAIAQTLVEKVENFIDKLYDNQDRLLNIIDKSFENNKKNLLNIAHELQNKTYEFFKDHQYKLVNIQGSLSHCFDKRIYRAKEQTNQYQEKLKRIAFERINKEKIKIDHMKKVIGFVRPENMLKRGFSIIRGASGKSIKTIDSLKCEDKVIAECLDGYITSIVKDIEKKKG